MNRRKLMNMMAAGGAGVALTTLVKTEQVNADGSRGMTTEEQAAPVISAARAFSGQHSPKPLPFDPAQRKGISEKLIKSHWANNYRAAIKDANVSEPKLASVPTGKDLP